MSERAGALNRARAANALGRFDDAAREARVAIAEDPTTFEGYGLLAQALLGNGAFDGAKSAADDGLRHAPDNEWLHRLRSIGLRHTNRLEEALAAADEATRLAPDSGLAHHERGDVLRALKGTVEARAAYEKQVELEPNSPNGHAALGLLCLEDEPVTAERHLRRALQLDARDAAVLNNLDPQLRAIFDQVAADLSAKRL